MQYELSKQDIEAILAVLSKGDRVELIPTKDRVKILRVRRDEVGKE